MPKSVESIFAHFLRCSQLSENSGYHVPLTMLLTLRLRQA